MSVRLFLQTFDGGCDTWLVCLNFPHDSVAAGGDVTRSDITNELLDNVAVFFFCRLVESGVDYLRCDAGFSDARHEHIFSFPLNAYICQFFQVTAR